MRKHDIIEFIQGSDVAQLKPKYKIIIQIEELFKEKL